MFSFFFCLVLFTLCTKLVVVMTVKPAILYVDLDLVRVNISGGIYSVESDKYLLCNISMPGIHSALLC